MFQQINYISDTDPRVVVTPNHKIPRLASASTAPHMVTILVKRSWYVGSMRVEQVCC